MLGIVYVDSVAYACCQLYFCLENVNVARNRVFDVAYSSYSYLLLNIES